MSRYRNHNDGGDDHQRLQRDKDRLFAGRDGSARAPHGSRGASSRYASADSGRDSGYSSDRSSSGRYASAQYDDRRKNGVTAENATEEDVDYIRSQVKNTKMQTLQSSRNALRMVMDAESNATRTMDQLGSQSEALNRMEHRMDVTQIHADIASDKSAHLKALNRSMFRPVFKNPFASKKRGEEKLAKAQAQSLAAQDDRRSRQQDEPKGRGGGQEGGGYRSRRDYSPSSYDRYQFEADEDDHEVERELASNLDNVSEAAARLKNMALSMNGEIETQNVSIGRLTGKVDKTGATIASNSARLRSIK